MIVVTDRTLCGEHFFDRIEALAQCHPEMIILREKDTPYDQLIQIAERCLEICETYEVPLSLNGDLDVARELDICRVHLPISKMRSENLDRFSLVGVSVHSTEEAIEAESYGADYLIAGHIFETSCKPFSPRGIRFLKEICDSVDIPVYAIGGINEDNVGEVASVDASGVCSMSGAMTTDDPNGLVRSLSVPFL